MDDLDGIVIRAPEPDEYRVAANTTRTALLSGPISDADFDRFHLTASAGGDWLTAWDGDRCVGQVGSYRFDTTVPGGARLDTAGYSRVGVLPTHTRRGILTTLMRDTLHDCRERGQALASLRASEATIYRRFGFGVAGSTVAHEITVARALPLRARPAHGTIELLPHASLLETLPPLYDRIARQRVGTIGRGEFMWKRYLTEATGPVEGFGTGQFVAVHRNPDGAVDGYVHYATSIRFDLGERGKGEVRELFAASPAVELALWQYLFEIDLVDRWVSDNRPIDDTIASAVWDLRACVVKEHYDEQWLRLLDVHSALTARTYGPGRDPVTVGVHDPLFADNCGRWTIADGTASRTDAPADVDVDIATLSAAYLGGVAWSTLLFDADDDVLTLLDAHFRIPRAPFCDSFF